MNRKLSVLALLLVASAVGAQGLVNFYNNQNTLIYGCSGTHSDDLFFGLLIALAGTTDPSQFSFSNVYGTNEGIAGRFTGGSGATAFGWHPGETMSFMVAGWSRSLGSEWQPGWLNGNFKCYGCFGLSAVGTGIAGGFDGTNSMFALNVLASPPDSNKVSGCIQLCQRNSKSL